MFVGIYNQRKMFEEYEKKRVYVELRSGRKYAGIVQNILSLDKKQYLKMKDLKGRTITFPIDQIKLIQEENGRNN